MAIALGAFIGHFWPEFGESLKPLGDGFIKLVKMVIAPVIFLTIVTGIAGMRDIGRVGRVAAKAFAYFLTFSTLALIVGLIVANVVKPGRGLNIDPASLNAGAVAQYATAAHEDDHRRLFDRDHPRHPGQRLFDRQHPAGAVRVDPVRHRPGPDRGCRQAGADPVRIHQRGGVQAGGHRHEGRAHRGLRRLRLHHRRIRHRLGGQPGPADRRLLSDRRHLRGRGAGPGRARQRVQRSEADPLSEGGAASGAGHLFVRGGPCPV